MHDTRVSQQVMRHHFLTTVICAWRVGQTLRAKLNQPDFWVSADVDPEVCEAT